MFFVRTIQEGRIQPNDAIKMPKLAEKQIKMVQIPTETDTIDDISCFLSLLHDCRGRLHAKNKSDSGKNQTGFSSFGANPGEEKVPDPVSKSDDSVTFGKNIKNAIVTQG